MAATTRVYSSGGNNIDALLASYKWDVATVRYSFTQSSAVYGNNYGSGEAKTFAAVNSAQREATVEAMKMWSEISNLKIELSTSPDAELRVAVSSNPATAWAYLPSTADMGGDVWLGTRYLSSPDKGNYAYLTIIHEIGHALGLRHPHEAVTVTGNGEIVGDAEGGLCPCCAGALHGQGAGGAAGNVAVTGTDAMAYSVMSYRSYEGQSTTNGYTNETFGYAQSPMARDIAAMQYLYGANYNTRAGDTVYRWSPTTGEKFINGVGQGAPGGNRVFETVWDGGGVDTFDLSNHTTGLTVDLTPGGWTSFNNSQRASLGGGQMAPGNVAVAYLFENNPAALIENAVGGSGDDRITGNDANNVLVGGAGNDTIYGGGGKNTLIGDGVGNEFKLLGLDTAKVISLNLPTVTTEGNDILVGGSYNDLFVPGLGQNEVQGGAGTDTVVLDFARDALTITGSANGVMNVVYAGGSVKMTGVEILALRDGIFSLVGAIPGLATVAAASSFADEIELLYSAGFGRDIDQGGLAYWSGAVKTMDALHHMAAALIDSPEFESRFGTPDTMANNAFIDVLYKNVLGRAGETGGVSYWQTQLSSGMDRADLLLSFAFSDENRAKAEHGQVGSDWLQISQADWAKVIWA